MSQVYGQMDPGHKWHLQGQVYQGWSRCWYVRLDPASLTETRPPEKDICRRCEPVKKET